MDDDIDYKQAARELLKDAKHGDPEAQCLLGQMYYEGLGVKQDYKQATLWLQKAVKQGNEEAQAILAKIKESEAKISTPAQISTKPKIKRNIPVKQIALTSAFIVLAMLTALGAVKLWNLKPEKNMTEKFDASP